MKKVVLSTIAATSLLIPSALASPLDFVSGIAQSILKIGNLSWLGVTDTNIITSFTRLLIFFLVFTILFAVIVGLGGKTGTAPMKFFSRGQAGVVAAIIATITAVFLPPQILLATGVGWATIVSFILIGGPIVGIFAIMWALPGKGNTETKGTVALKFVLCLLLSWILSVMHTHITKLSTAVFP